MIGGIYGKERTADHRHHSFWWRAASKNIFADLIIKILLQNQAWIQMIWQSVRAVLGVIY